MTTGIRHLASGAAAPHDRTDCTPALQALLDAGPGIVIVGPGFYRCAEVSIPRGVTLAGAGAATVMRPAGGAAIFRQSGIGDWAIRDLVLDGEATEDWRERRDDGRHGMVVQGCWGYDVAGLTLRNFRGAGLQIGATALGPEAPFCNGGNLDRITASGNYAGVRFDQRAEYTNATRFSLYQNVIGCVIHAGNTKLTASNICSNVDGFVVEDKENGSHGAVSNCLVNHNSRYALLCRRVRNGMLISNCCFFCGAIRIEDSQGVNLSECELSCGLSVTGEGANRVAGNYLATTDHSYAFTPSTLIHGNFTPSGPWGMNRR